ncbi:MAG: ATP-binding protein [Simplicispira sp.]|nr:ATP-binding protein [Simplicispira sp.]
MTTPAHPLLLQPEGKTLEFKRDLSSPQNVLKTLVAFANSAGGKLVIGVDDARQVVGVADPLAEEERICNLIADAIAPRLLPNVELMSVGDATVLVVEVFPSGARPHYLLTSSPTLAFGHRLRGKEGDSYGATHETPHA